MAKRPMTPGEIMRDYPKLKARIAELETLITNLHKDIAIAAKDLRENTHETIEANTQKEEMQHSRDCQYDDMVVYRDQLEAKTKQCDAWKEVFARGLACEGAATTGRERDAAQALAKALGKARDLEGHDSNERL